MQAYSMQSLKASLPIAVGVLPRPMQQQRQRPASITLHSSFTAFEGLGAGNRLQLSMPAESNLLEAPQNGIKVFAMRHGKRIARLGRPADQRKALVRALTTEVLRHGRITTTVTRAKAIRKYVDKMITLAKDGSLHARRQVLGFVYDKTVVKALFEEAPKRYGDRAGGYCRVVKEERPRRGDAASMAVIELV